MFNFNRRINRRTLLLGCFLSIFLWVPFLALAEFVNNSSPDGELNATSLWVLAIGLVTFFMYTLCLVKQRCNDISNDHAVLLAVVLYVTGFAFLLLILPGEKRENAYGPEPVGLQLLW